MPVENTFKPPPTSSNGVEELREKILVCVPFLIGEVSNSGFSFTREMDDVCLR